MTREVGRHGDPVPVHRVTRIVEILRDSSDSRPIVLTLTVPRGSGVSLGMTPAEARTVIEALSEYLATNPEV